MEITSTNGRKHEVNYYCMAGKMAKCCGLAVETADKCYYCTDVNGYYAADYRTERCIYAEKIIAQMTLY